MAGMVSGAPIYTLPNGKTTTDRAAYMKAQQAEQIAR